MPNTSFDAIKITAGKFTPKSGTVMDIGCTGALSGTTVVKPITKMCEGVPVKEVNIPQYMELTFRGHMYTEAYRAMFGFKADETILTKHAYGSHSRNKSGEWSWEVENLEGDFVKTMVFPNGAVATGYAFNYENGLEEIAEVEVSIKAMVDENGDIYTEDIVAVP